MISSWQWLTNPHDPSMTVTDLSSGPRVTVNDLSSWPPLWQWLTCPHDPLWQWMIYPRDPPPVRVTDLSSWPPVIVTDLSSWPPCDSDWPVLVTPLWQWLTYHMTPMTVTDLSSWPPCDSDCPVLMTPMWQWLTSSCDPRDSDSACRYSWQKHLEHCEVLHDHHVADDCWLMYCNNNNQQLYQCHHFTVCWDWLVVVLMWSVTHIRSEIDWKKWPPANSFTDSIKQNRPFSI